MIFQKRNVFTARLHENIIKCSSSSETISKLDEITHKLNIFNFVLNMFWSFIEILVIFLDSFRYTSPSGQTTDDQGDSGYANDGEILEIRWLIA